MTDRGRLASFVLLVLVVASGACTFLGLSGPSWRPPRVVTIESDVPLGSLLPSWSLWHSDAAKGEPQALMLRDGDLVWGKDLMVRHFAGDGPALRLVRDRGTIRLGETTVSVSLGDEGGRSWIGGASDGQLALVRTVDVPGELDAAALASLERLASVNAHVDVMMQSDDALAQVLARVRPRALFVERGVDAASLHLLADQPQIETLQVCASGPESLDALAELPGLRNLTLTHWDVERAGPLPAGLDRLRSLVVIESTMRDLTVLAAAPSGLEELSLIALKHLPDVSGIERMAGLSTLILWGDSDPAGLRALDSLQHLRRVALPPGTTQEQFAAFVGAHPDLAILELIKCEKVTDLSPLRGLRDLEGLVLAGPPERLEPLRGLASLRYVGVAAKTWDAAPESIAALRGSLPDAIVVRVKPFCLGSGWILLLVPVLAFAWVLRKAPRRERA